MSDTRNILGPLMYFRHFRQLGGGVINGESLLNVHQQATPEALRYLRVHKVPGKYVFKCKSLSHIITPSLPLASFK